MQSVQLMMLQLSNRSKISADRHRFDETRDDQEALSSTENFGGIRNDRPNEDERRSKDQ